MEEENTQTAAETAEETQIAQTEEVEAQTEGAVQTDAPPEKTKKSRAGEVFKNYFTATRIAYIAIFTALAFVLRMLQFSVLPATPYLKLDFSDAFVLVCAYALGPVAGIISGILKELIYGICFTSTAFVGELANVIVMLPFILIPSILYKKHKGIKAVLVGLAIACVVRTVWSIPVNMLLNFPVFVGFNWPVGIKTFLKVWYWATLFNLIKVAVLSVVSFLLYKPLSKLIKITGEKFAKMKKK